MGGSASFGPVKNKCGQRSVARFPGWKGGPWRMAIAALLVFVQAGLLPVLLALLALADPGHRPEIRVGAEGLEVVLRHDRCAGSVTDACPVRHAHGLVGTWLAGRSVAATHPDHVVRAGRVLAAAAEPEKIPVPRFCTKHLPADASFPRGNARRDGGMAVAAIADSPPLRASGRAPGQKPAGWLVLRL